MLGIFFVVFLGLAFFVVAIIHFPSLKVRPLHSKKLFFLFKENLKSVYLVVLAITGEKSRVNFSKMGSLRKEISIGHLALYNVIKNNAGCSRAEKKQHVLQWVLEKIGIVNQKSNSKIIRVVLDRLTDIRPI